MKKESESAAQESELAVFIEWAGQVAKRADVPSGIRKAAQNLHDRKYATTQPPITKDAPSNTHHKQLSDNNIVGVYVEPAVRPSDITWPERSGPMPTATVTGAAEGTQAPNVFVLEDVPAPAHKLSPEEVSNQAARFAIDGAIAYGQQGTNKPPSDDHWLMPYWEIGRKLAPAQDGVDVEEVFARLWHQEMPNQVSGEVDADRSIARFFFMAAWKLAASPPLQPTPTAQPVMPHLYPHKFKGVWTVPFDAQGNRHDIEEFSAKEDALAFIESCKPAQDHFSQAANMVPAQVELAELRKVIGWYDEKSMEFSRVKRVGWVPVTIAAQEKQT